MRNLSDTTRHPTMIAGIIAARRISDRQVVALRRWFAGRGASTHADMLALLDMNAAVVVANAALSALMIEEVTDFLVYQQKPTGRIGEADADWLIAALGGGCGGDPGRARTPGDDPGSRHRGAGAPGRLCAPTGAPFRGGGRRPGRVRPRASLAGGGCRRPRLALAPPGCCGGPGRRAVSREEAEVLFDIGDACQGPGNHPAWAGLFVDAVTDHVRRSAGQSTDLAGTETWLLTRLRRQGWPGSAAQALRALVQEADWAPRIPVLADVA